MINNQFKNQYLGTFYLLKQISDKVNDDTRIIIKEIFGISDKNEKKIKRNFILGDIFFTSSHAPAINTMAIAKYI